MSMEDSREKHRQKMAIYEAMGPRRRKFIDRIGFEKWDPFQEPNNPSEIRRDGTQRTSKELMRQFFYERPPRDYSNAYGRGVLEMCMGIINCEDRYRAMYEFSLWYRELLQRENKEFKEQR